MFTISKALVTFALGILSSQVNKIQDDIIRPFILRKFVPLEKFLLALFDNNPDNKAQLEQLWQENSEEIVDDVLLTAAALGEREIKNEFLALQVKVLFESIAALDLFNGDNSPESLAAKQKAFNEIMDKMTEMRRLNMSVSAD